jgi:LysR family glycine cleavage system transcriptional activator
MERRRLPPLNALRAFEAAARHMNFSRAADELSVTPGAVSQQIQNLEDFIGVALFKRTPKGLLLTDAAQTALPALRDAFDKLGEAASQLTAPVDGRRVTVSAAPSFAAKWLMPRLGRFEAAHPDMDVWLSAGMELVDFASGEIDVAIRYGSGRYPGLEVIRLMSETVTPVAAPALLAQRPIATPDDLGRHILLHDGSPDADESCPDWIMWLTARGVKGVDGARGPRFNQSSLVIEAAVLYSARFRLLPRLPQTQGPPETGPRLLRLGAGGSRPSRGDRAHAGQWGGDLGGRRRGANSSHPQPVLCVVSADRPGHADPGGLNPDAVLARSIQV